jgi:endonuclease YncB( thermonuclease family)
MNKMLSYYLRKSTITGQTIIILLPFILTSAVLAVSQSFTGKCVAVHDGDTIGVMHNGVEEKIRVYGIDAPELHQDFGSRAKQFTSDLVFGKIVTVEVKNRDLYGRTVGRIKVDKKDLSLELAKAGMAWYYKKYSNDPELAKAEKEAQSKKLGLWSMSNPTAPWDFRREKISSGNNQNSESPKSLSKGNKETAIAVDTVDAPHGKHIMYTGPNGGKYYINKKGKKVYIEK